MLKLAKSPTVRFFLFCIALGISIVILANRDKFSGLDKYGYLGVFILSLLGNATIVVPIPVFLAAFIGGGLFNPLLIGLIASGGATLGEITGYLAGIGGHLFVAKDKRFGAVKKWVEKRGFLTILILAAIPNPVFDLAGIASGITSYPIGKFLLATFLGKLLKFLAIALLGDYFFSGAF